MQMRLNCSRDMPRIIFPRFSHSAWILGDLDLKVWLIRLTLKRKHFLRFNYHLLGNVNILQKLIDDSPHRVPPAVQMDAPNEVVNAHKDCAPTLGNSQ